MTNDVRQKVSDFFTGFPLRSYPKGQILIYSGDLPDSVFYLVSGKVKQYDISYRGDEIILNVFKTPAFFPMSLAINQTTNSYFYETETAVELHKAPIDATLAFLQANGDVTYDLLSRLYLGIDGLLGRMAHLMTSSAKSRLLYELILESRRFGEQQPDGSYVISINERELGARAGLTRETVNREVKKLKQETLLEVRSADMRVPSLVSLEQKLGMSL